MIRYILCIVAALVFVADGNLVPIDSMLGAAETSADSKTTDSPKRTAWTSSQVFGSPDPPSPFRTERAFNKLAFQSPIELVAIPGSNRMLVA